MSNKEAGELLGIGFAFILIGFIGISSSAFRNTFTFFGLDDTQLSLIFIIGIGVGIVFVIGGIRTKR